MSVGEKDAGDFGGIVCIHILKESEKRTSAHIGVWEGGREGMWVSEKGMIFFFVTSKNAW